MNDRLEMNADENPFFEKLVQRIAALHNERGLLQAQPAEILGYSQQHELFFENGRRRAFVSTLPELSRALGVPVEELLGADDEQPAKRGTALKLQRQLEQLCQLPRSQQRFVSHMLDPVLQQAER